MSGKPNVLFLILDSLRIDRVSCYGHDRVTTPALDELAEEATQYTNAYTPAPWTLPTHCSLFTGLFPSEHGVTNGFLDQNIRLPDSFPTITERLSGEGYRTAGFSNNPWVGKTSGLDRGFDDFVEWNLEIRREISPSIHDRTDRLASHFHSIVGHAARQPIYLLKRPFFTDSLTERARRWISGAHDTEEPWFCFMNLMEAHSPYFPRKWAFEALDLDPPGWIEPRVLNTKLLAYVMGRTNLDSDLRKRVLEYYDAAVRYQDRKVGELLDLLREQDIFDDTLVVICSDHGKTLGDFDRSGRPPHYLRDINTRVPLIVKEPDIKTSDIVDSPVELVSLHEFIVNGASCPLSDFQPDADHALFEDFVPHTGRRTPDDGVTYWRGLGTPEGKFVLSDTGESYFFEGRGSKETAEDDPADDAKRMLSEALSDRIEKLSGRAEIESNNIADDLSGDVQAQLKDLGYL